MAFSVGQSRVVGLWPWLAQAGGPRGRVAVVRSSERTEGSEDTADDIAQARAALTKITTTKFADLNATGTDDGSTARGELEQFWVDGFKRRKRVFLPYPDASRWAQGLSLDSQEEWVEWIERGEKRTSYIPLDPEKYYTGTGKWVSWEHFLKGPTEAELEPLEPIVGEPDVSLPAGVPVDANGVKPPSRRKFGWALKEDLTASVFHLERKANGQLAIMLHHPTIRGGCTCEMLYWWFQHFANLKVRLLNVEGWEDEVVSAYFLWHPTDHIAATLPHGGLWTPGDKLCIQEMLQYDVHGASFYVNDELELYHLLPGSGGGQSMGKALPLLGPLIRTRIQWKDVPEGVAYHYEIAIGQANPNPVQRFIVDKIAGKFNEDFMGAWHRHNLMEVGCFENFLPALFYQRAKLAGPDGQPDFSVPLEFDAKAMNSAKGLPRQTAPFDQTQAEARWRAMLDAPDSLDDLNKADFF